MTTTIITEGSETIGLGHVMRSVALAKKLNAKIHCVNGHAQLRSLVRTHGIKLEAACGASIIIRDLCTGYPPRSSALTIDIVDEARERSGDADLVFAAFGESRPSKGIYAGLDYAILRSEFESVPERDRCGILVCLGGVDPTNSTPRIVNALDGSATPVARPGNFNESISSLLSQSKIAIASAGNTMIEAAACGTPTLVVSHNQREHARMIELIDRGYGSFASEPLNQHVGSFRYLGSATTLDVNTLVTAVDVLLASQHTLDLMSAFGRHNVDGHGAERVASVIRLNRREVTAVASAAR